MKHSSQNPAVPIMMYDPQLPPVIPNCILGLPQEVTQHSGQIAVAIINEAGSKAPTNAARMYCYNALTENCYNNQFFEEAFNLAAGLVGLNMKKQPYTSVLQHIKSAVDQTLTLLSGALLHREPELKSLMAPRLIDAANQNIPILSDLQQEINHMFPSTPNPGYAMNPGMSGMPPSVQVAIVGTNQGPALTIQFPNSQPQFVPLSNFNGQLFVNINNQQFQVMAGPQGVMININGNWIPANNVYGQQMQQQMPQQSMYNNQMPQQNNYSAPVPPMDNQRFSGGTFAKPADTTGNFIKQGGAIDHRYSDIPIQQPQPTQNQPTQVVQTNEVIDNSFKTLTLKGETMGAAEIHILGNTFSLNGVVRQQAVRDALSSMSAVTNGVGEDCTVVHPNFIYALDIEEAFRNGKIDQLTRLNSNVDLYRVFGCVMNPIITKHKELKDFVKTIRSSLTITEIANRLQSMGGALSSGQFDKVVATDMAMVLATIDQMLTSLTNKYLAINMFSADKEITIGSFTEDALDIPKYLQRTRGQAHLAAFESFEKTLLENFSSVVQTAEDELIYGLDLPEELVAVSVPTGFSITYTSLTSKEFGFNLKKEPVVVDRQVAPELYKICQTLVTHKKTMDAYTQHDYLVTADGAKYRLYNNAISADMYLIEKS